MSTEQLPPLVVHVIYSLGTGGLENGLVNLINRTPGNRYRHAIICLAENGSFEQRLHDRSVEVIALHRRPGKDLTVYWRLWKHLKAMQPAIVHTRNLSALEAQVPARCVRGVHTVHGVHGRDVFDLEGKSRKYNLLRKLIRPLVGRYITVSKDLERWLHSTVGVPGDRITQIYNGVDPTLFHPGSSGHRPGRLMPAGFLAADSLVVGTVGRLAAVKDQAALVRAFAEVVKRMPDARLVIAGDGPMRKELEALVEQLGLPGRVWITGDRDDIPDILRLLDIFVLPSLGEGISNTILEAMATGLPIVATDVGGNRELVEEGCNGRLVPVGDPARLAEAIFDLMQSAETRVAMGQSSLERVSQQFDWDRTVDSYLGVYDNLLGRYPSTLIREQTT